LDFQIAPKFGKPITLRNLMTHTGGFEEEIRDIILTNPKQEISLRDFMIANQPHRMFPPGIVPAYSNYGVGLAGYIVQRVSGEPFEQYVSEHIFDPLGMKHSSFHEPMQSDLTTFVSDGYRGDTESPAIGFEIFNPAPAGGISSTAADMGQFAQALLGGGEWNGHRILKPETLDAMWTRQFAASDQLPGICMGFYQVWRNGLHYIGHEGDLIAFHSLFFVEPKEQIVLFISYNSTNSEYTSRDELINGFTDRYYPYTPSPDFQKLPLDRLQGIEGAYQPTRRADSTKLRLGNLLSQRQASVDKDGVLTIEDSKDLRGHERKWKSIGKDLWQAEGDQERVFAIRDSDGKVIRAASDFAGVQFERVRWFDDSRFNHPLLLSSLGILLLVVVASLIRIGRRIFFAKRPSWKAVPGTARLTLGTKISAYAWILLTIGVAVLMGKLEGESFLPTRGVDKYFVLMNWGAVIAILLSIFPVIAGVRIWQKADTRWVTRVKFSFVSLACLFLVWFSIHWNILGPAHRF
jgi:CubicO group peptidase (beta-lactamase class C family)